MKAWSDRSWLSRFELFTPRRDERISRQADFAKAMSAKDAKTQRKRKRGRRLQVVPAATT